jgi:nitrate/nitrite transporter NarK
VGFTLVGYAALPLAERLGDWRQLSWTLGFAVLVFAAQWLVFVHDAPRSRASTVDLKVLARMGRVVRMREVWVPAVCYGLFNAGYLGATGYLPTYLVTHRAQSPESAGAFVSVCSWAFILGCLSLPALSDRIGLRRHVYFINIAIVAATLAAIATVDVPLIAAAAAWGFASGVQPLLFAMPLESKRLDLSLGGSAAGLVSTLGFVGGFLGPLIGMTIAGLSAAGAILFWTGCYLASAVLIRAMPETGSGRAETSAQTRAADVETDVRSDLGIPR